MQYCKRCVYPQNAKPTIIFDDDGVCSGCRVHEAKSQGGEIDWTAREAALRKILDEYKARAKHEGNFYDCLIPVSGGKDSTYQVYLAKEIYGMNPLLVTYNHVYNTRLGLRNLRNLVKRFNCDLVRFTPRPDAIRKIDRYMIRRVGDITWHYHTGIFTYPFRVAIQYRIPLVLWGEHGHAEMTGMFRLEDIPEFTKWSRDEYQMRGVRIEELVEAEDSGITAVDVAPYIFPPEEKMQEIGIRGIYLGNYIKWDHLALTDFVIRECGFKILTEKRDRTFSLFHKLDDHANDVHDYLKYLKFGYGRGTDHASHEVRLGRMTREEAIDLVTMYDNRRPSSLDFYLDFLGMSEREFESAVEPMRDLDIWEKDADGRWQVKDSVANHADDSGVEEQRLPLVSEESRTFGHKNRHLYYSTNHEPPKFDDTFVDNGADGDFIIL